MCISPPLDLDHDYEDGRPQLLPQELCCQCLPDGPLLHQVVDHLKLNFFFDYPAHKDIKHAGEVFENNLEQEDHLLTFNWLHEGFSSANPRGNENISEKAKNDPLEFWKLTNN